MVIHSLYSGFPKAVTMLGKLEQGELCRTIFPTVVWSWTMPLQSSTGLSGTWQCARGRVFYSDSRVENPWTA